MTIFIYKDKKLFEVNFIIPIDIGDIVEYDKFEYDANPSEDYPYPQFKVIGRMFRHKQAFSGDLYIFLQKL
jgi:hypothetical protein